MKEQRFEKIVEWEDPLGIRESAMLPFLGIITSLSIIGIILNNITAYVAILTIGVMALVTVLTETERKVYWRKVK
ncbi:MAG: hypothetical protein JSW08_03115 [archaeon]|nr:MAG: hypothetical protein JSW08_03115 [archaeon]